jgi:transporter family-2 protein
LCGALLPIQASINAQLARSLTSALLAANVSYFIGFLVLVALLLSQHFDPPAWFALPKAPRWSLSGGLFGAWYVASSAYFISILGATLTLGLVVFGQAIAGMISDHCGWLGLPQNRLTRYRRIAIGLLMVAIFFLVQ